MAGAGRAADDIGAAVGRDAGAAWGAAVAGRETDGADVGAPGAGGRGGGGAPTAGGGGMTPALGAPGGGGPPAGKLGNLIVAVGLGGKLMRTVSFFG